MADSSMRAPALGSQAPSTWQDALAAAIVGAKTDVIAYVPDSRLRGVIAAIDDAIRVRTLTREEECIGFAAGFRAAGGRPVVMMQSSGLGNSLNAIGSLVVPYRLGFPLVVTMRGTLGERNPSQVPIGRATRALLDAFGIQAYPLLHAADVAVIAPQVFTLAFETSTLAAVMLEPTLEADCGPR
jgi:sulfopyruvate decarboxylase alpha subunit